MTVTVPTPGGETKMAGQFDNFFIAFNSTILRQFLPLNDCSGEERSRLLADDRVEVERRRSDGDDDRRSMVRRRSMSAGGGHSLTGEADLGRFPISLKIIGRYREELVGTRLKNRGLTSY